MPNPILRSFSCGLALVVATAATAQNEPNYELAPIRYSATAPQDAVTRLQARLAAGLVSLAGDERQMVSTVLAELGVPAECQGSVKTGQGGSLQNRPL